MIVIDLICCALLGGLAYVAIPGNVRQLIVENCFDAHDRLKMRYLWRECKSVTRFYSQIGFPAFVVSCIAFGVLFVIDSYVSLGIVKDVVMHADWDVDAWKRNLKLPPASATQRFTNDYIQSGGSVQGARSIMRVLWALIPVILLASFVATMFFTRVLFSSYNNAVRSLAREESARNLRRIRRHYLSTAAPPSNES